MILYVHLFTLSINSYSLLIWSALLHKGTLEEASENQSSLHPVCSNINSNTQSVKL